MSIFGPVVADEPHMSKSTITRAMPATDDEGLHDVDYAAAFLKTTPRHVRRLTTERRLAFVKVGKFTRYRTSDLVEYIERQRVERVR